MTIFTVICAEQEHILGCVCVRLLVWICISVCRHIWRDTCYSEMSWYKIENKTLRNRSILCEKEFRWKSYFIVFIRKGVIVHYV